MKVTLSMPDELYEKYQSEAPLAKKSPENLMVSRLLEFQDIKGSERYLLIKGSIRQELEKLLSGTLLSTGEQLLSLVKKLTTMSLNGMELTLTEAELKELNQMATRNKTTVEFEMSQRISIIKPLIFNSAQFVKMGS